MASDRLRPMGGTEAKRLHRDWRRRTERPVAAVLDNVQTPFNVGAIVRTAASFRLDHLYVVGATGVTPHHAKSQKTSLGTERLVPWSEHERVDDAITAARGDGLQVIGIELVSGAVPLHEVVAPSRGVCLVVGHEDRGLSSAAIAGCDRLAYIPTPGKVGSLNVATAFAIALYEIRRQEWTAPPPSD